MRRSLYMIAILPIYGLIGMGVMKVIIQQHGALDRTHYCSYLCLLICGLGWIDKCYIKDVRP